MSFFYNAATFACNLFILEINLTSSARISLFGLLAGESSQAMENQTTRAVYGGEFTWES